MEEKKYKLTDEFISETTTIYRIQALKDFGDVKKGDLGGFVGSEANLSQNGDAWIYNDAKVFGNAIIFGNAKVYGNAQVFGNALVYENAHVYGYVHGRARIHGNAKVYGESEVTDDATVDGNARIYGYAIIHDKASVSDNACVCHADVYGNAYICGDAKVSSMQDYIVFQNWWSNGMYFTWTRSDDMWTCGCFHGTGKELIEKAYNDSEVSGREYERIVNYVESIKSEINKIKQ